MFIFNISNCVHAEIYFALVQFLVSPVCRRETHPNDFYISLILLENTINITDNV